MCRNGKEKVSVAFVGTWCDKATGDQVRSAHVAVEQVIERHAKSIACLPCSATSKLWESSLSVKSTDALVQASVKRCAEGRNRLASRAVHQTLAQVRQLAQDTHIARLSEATEPR